MLTDASGRRIISPWDDAVVPSLSERDARLLARKIIEALHAKHVSPTRFGLSLDRDGFWFTADINGRSVSARTGQGSFTYAQVAHDLVLASTDPGWDTLTVQKGSA